MQRQRSSEKRGKDGKESGQAEEKKSKKKGKADQIIVYEPSFIIRRKRKR